MDGIILTWALIGGLIGILAGIKRGFNLAGSFAGGVLLGPLLAWLMFFMSGLVSRGERAVKCPYCAEPIKAAAVVCKHCGRDLPGNVNPLPTRAPAGRRITPPPPIKARPDGQSYRCAKPGCGRLLAGPTATCPHCGTAHGGA